MKERKLKNVPQLNKTSIDIESSVIKIAIICDKTFYGLFLFVLFLSYLFFARLVLVVCYNYLATCWMA